MPHEWEWQIAAQGTDDRNYPWGATAPAINVNMPAPDHGRTMRGHIHVDGRGSGAPGVIAVIGALRGYLPLPFMRHPLAGPRRVSARILHRDPCDRPPVPAL